MKVKKIALTLSVLSAATMLSGQAFAYKYKADETKYPVIFAHGMAGWDDLGIGYSYFGEDWSGTFVGDSCSFMELNGCNEWIKSGQQAKAEAFQVNSLQNSEVRGQQLYDHVRNYMATTGVTKVNFIGHSQGGMDIRKAAHLLKATSVNGVAAGTPKVGAMISVSSPHRGTPYAKKIYDQYGRTENNLFCGIVPALPNGADPCFTLIKVLADTLFDFANGHNLAGNSILQAGAQLIYDDYEATDGQITGAKAFNTNYNASGVSAYVGSVITAQDNLSLNPILMVLQTFLTFNADGDGYCVGDCDNDGAAGKGDGNTFDMDDDGLVPMNSQQMGIRLKYAENDCAGLFCMFGNPLDSFSEVTATGTVTDLNNPTSVQMTSHEGVLEQDHMDVVAFGPDEFDEQEFYAGMMDFIAGKGF